MLKEDINGLKKEYSAKLLSILFKARFINSSSEVSSKLFISKPTWLTASFIVFKSKVSWELKISLELSVKWIFWRFKSSL